MRYDRTVMNQQTITEVAIALVEHFRAAGFDGAVLSNDRMSCVIGKIVVRPRRESPESWFPDKAENRPNRIVISTYDYGGPRTRTFTKEPWDFDRYVKAVREIEAELARRQSARDAQNIVLAAAGQAKQETIDALVDAGVKVSRYGSIQRESIRVAGARSADVLVGGTMRLVLELTPAEFLGMVSSE